MYEELCSKIEDLNNKYYDNWSILSKDELKDFCFVVDASRGCSLTADYNNKSLTIKNLEEKYSTNLVMEYDDFQCKTAKEIKSCIIRAANDIWDNLFSRSFDALKTLEFNDNLREYIYYLLESAKIFKDIRYGPPECIDKIRAIYNIHTFVYNDDKKPKEKKEKEKENPQAVSRRSMSDSKRPKIV